ncbi:hypothetical protein UY3_12914 [Chelonia mydas]|uniref:Uncharacterized protein n=1 Tax=Chelonia mydas TaxID=8469 RepID=M7BP22_CHEMY|nr:hypothetical protein UY3_12914 [Chelonia mydas]
MQVMGKGQVKEIEAAGTRQDQVLDSVAVHSLQSCSTVKIIGSQLLPPPLAQDTVRGQANDIVLVTVITGVPTRQRVRLHYPPDCSAIDSCTPPWREAEAESTGERQQSTLCREDVSFTLTSGFSNASAPAPFTWARERELERSAL